jgi:PTS system ascorbate-specific IIB component
MADLRIMVVCGFGLGSSMVLKMTLDDVLKEEKITGVETFCSDSYVSSGEKYDIVFISQEWEYLFEKNPQPRVVIKNFLNKAEVREKGLGEIKKLIESKG